MAKKQIQYKRPVDAELPQLLEEPDVAYITRSKGFPLSEFQHLSGLLGFSLIEWAAILHVSERTLQRYLKADKPFTGLQAELLVHLKRLVDVGQQLFPTSGELVQWLRQPKEVLGQEIDFTALESISGIRLLHHELGRIAHGVYI